jgi:ATP-dependent DNA helicase RecG
LYVRQRDIDEARYLELIVNLARSNEYIARADVINLLRVKDSKAYGLLKELVNQGILEAVNKGRYAKYKLK